jgi:transcription initiation factor TFIID subunit 6
MKHSNRNKLQPEDINHALKLKNIEVSPTLKNNFKPIYGYKQRKEDGFKKVPNRKLYFLQDSELKIQDILQTSLPKIPIGPTITSHWLAIEGVQPKYGSFILKIEYLKIQLNQRKFKERIQLKWKKKRKKK